MGQNHYVAAVLMKSVCVVAVHTVCMYMLLSCWPGIWNTCVTWQGIDYKLPEDDTIVSKHVGVW